MLVKSLFALLFLRCSVDGLELHEVVLQSDSDVSKTENVTLLGETGIRSDKNHPEKTEALLTKPFQSNLIKTDDRTGLVTLNEFLDIWNPYKVAEIWNTAAYETLNLSRDCVEDFTDYLEGVSRGAQWALKMMDASGKYASGLFSGNKFWLGVADQCREMESQIIKWQKKKIERKREDLPPFQVGVTSVTLNLDFTETEFNGTYNILLGLCLPNSCDTKDVKKLLYFAEDRSRNGLPREISIARVRNLSKAPSVWKDPTFYALLVTFAVVLVFVIFGTLYDIALRVQQLHKGQKKEDIGNVLTELKIVNAKRNVDREITIAKLWSVKEHNGSSDVRNSSTVPKPLSEALLSFSLLLNLWKVFSFDVGGDTLAPIHGLRFFSILWIILIHTCLAMNETSENRAFKTSAETDFLYQTLSNGTYAVDTFFFVSGCLVSFLYFRTMSNDKMRKKNITKGCSGQVFQFIGMICYRYLRLTPPYLLIIGLVQVSSVWYYDNTMLDLYTIDYDNCHKHWWRNALYINTYFPINERCVVWSWYLANDTQFYTIGIIILIISASVLPVAAVMTAFFLISSWITTMIITLHVKHVPSIQEPFAHYESLYDKPWVRIGPYLIGMVVGWYLYKTDCKLKLNKAIVTIYWILSIAIILSLVYGLYGSTFSPLVSAFYTALSHSGWAVSVAWLLIACVTGNGGFVNKILSWKYLYPFSRLTYCVYLIHPLLIRDVVLRGESSMHLSQGLMAILFLGYTVASYAVSLIFSLFFEAPVVSLLRIAHPIREWKQTK